MHVKLILIIAFIKLNWLYTNDILSYTIYIFFNLQKMDIIIVHDCLVLLTRRAIILIQSF